MKKLELDIKGTEDYLNIVGGFIRHAFFFKKGAFKFIGVSAMYLDTREKAQISTVFGTELLQVIVLKLNTLDLCKLEKYLIGSFGNEHVRNFDETFTYENAKIQVRNINSLENVIEIKISGSFNILKSSCLNEVLGECEDFDIYTSIEKRPVEISLYAGYRYGYYTEEENKKMLRGFDSSINITVNTLHKYDCKFGYTVEKGYEPRLVLNVDENIDKTILENIIRISFEEILNSLK